jgi:hypothetical protein
LLVGLRKSAYVAGATHTHKRGETAGGEKPIVASGDLKMLVGQLGLASSLNANDADAGGQTERARRRGNYSLEHSPIRWWNLL